MRVFDARVPNADACAQFSYARFARVFWPGRIFLVCTVLLVVILKSVTTTFSLNFAILLLEVSAVMDLSMYNKKYALSVHACVYMY